MHLEETYLSHPISAFGIETLLGVSGCTCGDNSALLFQENNDYITISNYRNIVIAGNGYVAVSSDGTYNLMV